MKIKQIKQESITKKTSFDKCLLINVGSKPNQKKLNDLKAKYVFPIKNMKGTYLAMKNPILSEKDNIEYIFMEASNYTEDVDLTNFIKSEDTHIDLVVHDKTTDTYTAYIKKIVQDAEYVDDVDSIKYEEDIVVITEEDTQYMKEEIKEVEELIEEVEEIDIAPEPVQEPQPVIKTEEEIKELEVDISKYPTPVKYIDGRPVYYTTIKETIKTKMCGYPPNAIVVIKKDKV